MRLEHLFDGQLVYADRGTWVQPFRENEWLGWAEGTGALDGPRVTGTLRWLNHPRERPDGTWLPDYHAVATTNDDAKIFMRFVGLNHFDITGGEYHGRIVMSATFATDADQYRWLNRELGVIEAVAWAPDPLDDPRVEQWKLRAYTCVNELEPLSAP